MRFELCTIGIEDYVIIVERGEKLLKLKKTCAKSYLIRIKSLIYTHFLSINFLINISWK